MYKAYIRTAFTEYPSIFYGENYAFCSHTLRPYSPSANIQSYLVIYNEYTKIKIASRKIN